MGGIIEHADSEISWEHTDVPHFVSLIVQMVVETSEPTQWARKDYAFSHVEVEALLLSVPFHLRRGQASLPEKGYSREKLRQRLNIARNNFSEEVKMIFKVGK